MLNSLDNVGRYAWVGLPQSDMDLVVGGKFASMGTAYAAL